MEYFKPETVPINSIHNEKWVQERIDNDPSIMGLGDLVVIERERKQSTGGRLDFLLFDPDSQTMYETEIQLGGTDESHIIRTIEYWDIERRRFPSRDHKAVIVAEEITSRFFNVIYLMNRSIPIIAIQMKAIRFEDQVGLLFTKVLDVFESPEDEESIPGETTDRKYWENYADSQSITLMDELINNATNGEGSARTTYNKSHIAVGTNRRNFLWLHPRKRAGHCYTEIRTGKENIEKAKEMLEEQGIPFTHRRDDLIVLSLQLKLFSENKEIFTGILKLAWKAYS